MTALHDGAIGAALVDPAWLRGFEAKLENFPQPDGCWIWTGARGCGGYGVRYLPSRKGETRKQVRVHRVMWIASGRRLAPDEVLDHDGPSGCSNRLCANPEHLQAVTNEHNVSHTGNGLAAVNLRKTHCSEGHLLAGENLRELHRPGRGCHPCHLERGRRASALLSQAAETLGLGRRNYCRLYGQSAKVALGVIRGARLEEGAE